MSREGPTYLEGCVQGRREGNDSDTTPAKRHNWIDRRVPFEFSHLPRPRGSILRPSEVVRIHLCTHSGSGTCCTCRTCLQIVLAKTAGTFSSFLHLLHPHLPFSTSSLHFLKDTTHWCSSVPAFFTFRPRSLSRKQNALALITTMADNSSQDSQAGDRDHGIIQESESDAPTQLLHVESDYGFDEFGRRTFLDGGSVSVYAPPKQVLRRVQDALEGYAELQRDTNGLTIASNQAALAKIKTFLDACLDSFPSSMRPTPLSHIKAQQVFGTAELLEGILLHLTPRQLLDAIRVNHATLQIFKDSPKLLDMLHLRRHIDGFLRNNVSGGFPGISIQLDSTLASSSLRSIDEFTFNQVPVTVEFDRASNLAIGARCRSMQILQPPVVHMKATVSCCSFNYNSNRGDRFDEWGGAGFRTIDIPSPRPNNWDRAAEGQEEEEGGEDSIPKESTVGDDVARTLEIYCATGLTIGHIYDAAQKIRQAHLHCPHASVALHAADGTVKPEIIFAAVLTLKHDDPYLIKKDKANVAAELRRLEKGDEKGRLSFT